VLFKARIRQGRQEHHGLLARTIMLLALK